jgi:hypothetical protein
MNEREGSYAHVRTEKGLETMHAIPYTNRFNKDEFGSSSLQVCKNPYSQK